MQLVRPAECGSWTMLHLFGWAVMHPSCVVRTQWDLYVLAVLFSVCIITPFLICFDLHVRPLSFLGAAPPHYTSCPTCFYCHGRPLLLLLQCVVVWFGALPMA